MKVDMYLENWGKNHSTKLSRQFKRISNDVHSKLLISFPTWSDSWSIHTSKLSKSLIVS